MTRTLSARGGTFTLSQLDGASLLRGLLPFLALLFLGCAKPVEPGETRKLDSVGDGDGKHRRAGRAAGRVETYKYRSAERDGARADREAGRRDVAERSQGSAAPDQNGAQATSNFFPDVADEDRRVVADELRFGASDGRVYNVVAVPTPSRCGARSDERRARASEPRRGGYGATVHLRPAVDPSSFRVTAREALRGHSEGLVVRFGASPRRAAHPRPLSPTGVRSGPTRASRRPTHRRRAEDEESRRQ